jgi:hypothetical protein
VFTGRVYGPIPGGGDDWAWDGSEHPALSNEHGERVSWVDPFHCSRIQVQTHEYRRDKRTSLNLSSMTSLTILAVSASPRSRLRL